MMPITLVNQQSQQVAQQRVAESIADKEARQRALDELDASNRTIKKLKERQETLNNVTDMSAGEWQMKEERDKLLVRRLDLSSFFNLHPNLIRTQRLPDPVY